MSAERRGPALPLVVATAAVAVTVTGVLPVYLVSVLVVQLRAELGFGPSTLGALVAGFFGCSAAAALLTGRFGRDGGGTGVVRAAALLSTVSLLLIGLLARNTAALTGLLLVAGASNGFGQPASNALIAAVVPSQHQGLAYGAKQSAIPLSTLLGGLAVPLIALPFGWRAVFLVAAGLGLLAAVVVPRRIPPGLMPAAVPSPAAGPFRLPPLLVLSAGLMLAAGAGNSLGTFFVASAVAAGEDPGRAGVIAAVAGAGGVITRLVLGLVADRREGRWLLVVAVLIALGAGGHALLATHNRTLLTAGVILAYCSGWAWAGLAHYAVARMHPGATARASGVVQGGLALGASLGPLAFGAVSGQVSYEAAWTGTAVCSLIAGATVALGRGLLLHDRPALVEAQRARRQAPRAPW